jgi:hypothetical protein
VAVAFYLEMNLNDVTAETTYPLAAALDLLKDWARERLRSWVPGEFVSTEDLP